MTAEFKRLVSRPVFFTLVALGLLVLLLYLLRGILAPVLFDRGETPQVDRRRDRGGSHENPPVEGRSAGPGPAATPLRYCIRTVFGKPRGIS